MEKLASRHAISELFNWISLMENVIEEDEENLKSAVGSSVIQDYLQKYKVVFMILLTLFTKWMIHDHFSMHFKDMKGLFSFFNVCKRIYIFLAINKTI